MGEAPSSGHSAQATPRPAASARAGTFPTTLRPEAGETQPWRRTVLSTREPARPQKRSFPGPVATSTPSPPGGWALTATAVSTSEPVPSALRPLLWANTDPAQPPAARPARGASGGTRGVLARGGGRHRAHSNGPCPVKSHFSLKSSKRLDLMPGARDPQILFSKPFSEDKGRLSRQPLLVRVMTELPQGLAFGGKSLHSGRGRVQPDHTQGSLPQR